MFSPSLAQIHAEYRQSQLTDALAAERLVQSTRMSRVSSDPDRPSIARRIVLHVTDALSDIGGAVGGALAAAGRHPHHV